MTALSHWNKLGTNKDFPFLFRGLRGSKEEREADSPGYFNIMEASTIATIISNLFISEKGKLEPSDIAVITPYQKQTKVNLVYIVNNFLLENKTTFA